MLFILEPGQEDGMLSCELTLSCLANKVNIYRRIPQMQIPDKCRDKWLEFHLQKLDSISTAFWYRLLAQLTYSFFFLSTSFSFRLLPLGVALGITCLHLTLFLASFPVTPNLCMSSLHAWTFSVVFLFPPGNAAASYSQYVHYTSPAHVQAVSALPLLFCLPTAELERFLWYTHF